MDDEVRHIPKEGHQREQWVVGPDNEYERDVLYGGGGASIRSVLDALENVGTSLVTVSVNAETENYEGELHWQSAVKFTDFMLEDLREMADAVDRGDIDDAEALRVLTQDWLEVETYGSYAVSFSDHYADEDEFTI